MKLAGFAGALCLLLIAGASSAQNYLVPEGRNAYLLGASWFDTSDYHGFGADAAYDINGAVAFGLRFERNWYKNADPDLGGDFRESSIAPYLSILAFRPEPQVPIGVEWRVLYTLTALSGRYVDFVDRENHGYAISGALDFFSYWEASENVTVWPRVGGEYFVWSLTGAHGLGGLLSDDLPGYRWYAGVDFRIAEDLVLSANVLRADKQDTALRLSALILYTQSEWWQ